MNVKFGDRMFVPVELAKNVVRSNIGDEYLKVWKSNIIALLGEWGSFSSYMNAMLFLKKSPWQIVANVSLGCTFDFMYFDGSTHNASIFLRNASGINFLSSLLSLTACVPLFGPTFITASQISSTFSCPNRDSLKIFIISTNKPWFDSFRA